MVDLTDAEAKVLPLRHRFMLIDNAIVDNMVGKTKCAGGGMPRFVEMHRRDIGDRLLINVKLVRMVEPSRMGGTYLSFSDDEKRRVLVAEDYATVARMVGVEAAEEVETPAHSHAAVRLA